ncbi:flagellar basal body-associated FliL family protein [Granulicella sp. WH15]|uniref:flagellar basal body-associated FliL family protein n=1 Tax=Granulicella sp. WH15 TaxID=2602070 RepID=UPI0013A5A9F7|nr:flagellar basal body-associated FliL family protein [Granulicella sp. WH15]
MADSAVTSRDLSNTSAANVSFFPLVPFLIAVALSVVLAAGGMAGVLFWMARSGRIAKTSVPTALAASVATSPAKSRAISMEPMLVNLADPGGQSYLRIGIVLGLEEMPSSKDKDKKEEASSVKGGKAVDEGEAAMRDAALTIISNETADQLLSLEGKEALKQKLKAAMGKAVPGLKVSEIFFTDFLVQR